MFCKYMVGSSGLFYIVVMNILFVCLVLGGEINI